MPHGIVSNGPNSPAFVAPKTPYRPPPRHTQGKKSATTKYATVRKNPPSLAPHTSLKPTSLPVNTLQLRNDRLGTLVRKLTDAFTSASSWEDFVNAFRGPSYLADELDDINHPAACDDIKGTRKGSVMNAPGLTPLDSHLALWPPFY